MSGVHAVVFYLRRVSTKNTLRVWDDEAPLQNCFVLDHAVRNMPSILLAVFLAPMWVLLWLDLRAAP